MDDPPFPHTPLQLERGARMRFDPRGHVLVESVGGAVVDAGPTGLTILSQFATPNPREEVAATLEELIGGSGDLVAALGVVELLAQAGVLVPVSGEPVDALGWADPIEHARMLHDRRRTDEFLAAVAAAVGPGDVVLDIGTGSGVLAVAAVRAGARRVYAVEATGIADVAERVFRANGLDDRVTVVRGWSERIELPEPADVLVSEIIGSEPLEENLLETTLDARRRLLRPGARMVPSTLTMLVRPLLVPEAEAGRRSFANDAGERWRHWYDIDLGPLVDVAPTSPVLEPSEGETVATWTPVGPPVELVTIDLTTFEDATVRATADLVLDAPMRMNAVAVTFRAGLFGAIAHELDPWRWPASSWATAVWFLPEEIVVPTGETAVVAYERPPYGTPRLQVEGVPTA